MKRNTAKRQELEVSKANNLSFRRPPGLPGPPGPSQPTSTAEPSLQPTGLPSTHTTASGSADAVESPPQPSPLGQAVAVDVPHSEVAKRQGQRERKLTQQSKPSRSA